MANSKEPYRTHMQQLSGAEAPQHLRLIIEILLLNPNKQGMSRKCSMPDASCCLTLLNPAKISMPALQYGQY